VVNGFLDCDSSPRIELECFVQEVNCLPWCAWEDLREINSLKINAIIYLFFFGKLFRYSIAFASVTNSISLLN
jgi:hypothetical protein